MTPHFYMSYFAYQGNVVSLTEDIFYTYPYG